MPFIILLIAILLIFFNVRAMKKENNSFQSNFNNASNDMSEFEVKLGEMRREFSETILELQVEIQDLKLKLENNSVNSIENNTVNQQLDEDSAVEADYNEERSINSDKTYKDEDKTENLDYNSIKEEENSHIIDKKEDSNNIKINEIETLIKSGLSMDEISEKLGIGKGEVLLIKELYLK